MKWCGRRSIRLPVNSPTGQFAYRIRLPVNSPTGQFAYFFKWFTFTLYQWIVFIFCFFSKQQSAEPFQLWYCALPLLRAFRNIPRVTLLSVHHLNLLKVAPGGHVGRLIVWTEGTFRKLDSIFGTFTRKSDVKKGWTLPYPKMTNSDFTRLIRSVWFQANFTSSCLIFLAFCFIQEEITKVVRPCRKNTKKHIVHRNPLKKPALMAKL